MHRIVITTLSGETFEDKAPWDEIMDFVLGGLSYWKLEEKDAKGKLVKSIVIPFGSLCSVEVFEDDLTRKRT